MASQLTHRERTPLASALALLLIALVSASSIVVRADVSSKHALLLAKALSYERRLSESKGSTVGIAVLYAAGNEASKRDALSWVKAFQALGALKVHGVAMEASAMPFQRERVREFVRARGIDVLLACDGSPYAAVAALARELQILTASDVRAGIVNNLSLGILIEGDKPRILINIRAAKAEGVMFSARLLQLAELL
jgi:hypothetical protein